MGDLTHAMTWTDLIDVILSEILSQMQRTSIVCPLYETSTVIKLVETESRMVVAGGGQGWE